MSSILRMQHNDLKLRLFSLEGIISTRGKRWVHRSDLEAFGVQDDAQPLGLDQ